MLFQTYLSIINIEQLTKIYHCRYQDFTKRAKYIVVYSDNKTLFNDRTEKLASH